MRRGPVRPGRPCLHVRGVLNGERARSSALRIFGAAVFVFKERAVVLFIVRDRGVALRLFMQRRVALLLRFHEPRLQGAQRAARKESTDGRRDAPNLERLKPSAPSEIRARESSECPSTCSEHRPRHAETSNPRSGLRTPRRDRHTSRPLGWKIRLSTKHHPAHLPPAPPGECIGPRLPLFACGTRSGAASCLRGRDRKSHRPERLRPVSTCKKKMARERSAQPDAAVTRA